jgi:C4-dicarboxylate-specific signal transduction histidine kinase
MGAGFLVFALLMTRIAWTRNELERRGAERTAELTRVNDNLKREIAKHNPAEYLTGQFFECSPDTVLIIGTDYRYKRVNPAHDDRNWGRPQQTAQIFNAFFTTKAHGIGMASGLVASSLNHMAAVCG